MLFSNPRIPQSNEPESRPRGQHPDPTLIALGIQQPWAELILRGIKTLEIRRMPTRIRGRIYLYASKRLSALDAAREAIKNYGIIAADLPRGCVVGTVEIRDCRPAQPDDAEPACVPEGLLNQMQSWVLENADRCEKSLAVNFVPYGMWFYPFRRLQTEPRRRRRNGGV
ncbi:ASCH domain-containing protein [Planctomicrobium sp. SH664]|uniref:ASCH domain-containing protein n=1 Tax=Planctomicrobium sp. SH664 TaxID=3448125 RepID=UPI003F5CAAE4